MDVTKKAKDIAMTAGQYGCGVVGLGLGTVAMNMVPPSVPSYVRGLAAILAAYFGYEFLGKGKFEEFVKAASIGLGAAGALDLAKKLTEGKTGVLATINSKLPSLSGYQPGPQASIPSGPIAGLTENRLQYGLGASPTNKLLAA